MILNFDVEHQKLKYRDSVFVASGSQNYLSAHFTFTDDWDNLVKIAQFTSGKYMFNIELDETDSCIVPWEVLYFKGANVYIAVWGNNHQGDDNLVVTTNGVFVTVKNDGMNDYLLPQDPTMGIEGTVLYDIKEQVEIAEGYANAAHESELVAIAQAEAAATSAANALQSEQNAKTSEDNAAEHESGAAEYASNAQESAENADSSALNAKTSEDNAKESEDNAAESASSANTSAQNAATSEANALASEQNASASKDSATSSATAAAASASAAAGSATSAAQSKQNAQTSETNAKASETAAATSASNASESATSAAGSASDAQTAATTATNSKDTAVASAATAVSAATSAGNSATSASASATSAQTSANNASGSATQAGNSATAAANSATSANNGATLAEQWASKTNGTVDGTEYSAKYYAQQASASATTAQGYAEDAQDTADSISASLTQIATNAANIATNTSNIATNAENIATNTEDIANNATDIDIAEKRISNIEKLLQGNLYDYQTDETSAYTKTVPAGAMPYAGLEKLGGKTVVWNQLVNSGTTSVATISGHKYYTLIDGAASIVTSSGSAIAIVDDTADMVTDLTLCYGSGNEPTTIEQFREMFPADYYEYNSGELLSAGVTEVVSKKSDTTTLATYSVPAEIQALEGYGWSAGRVYNYIDYERKVFVQNVGGVDLGTLNWVYRQDVDYPFFYGGIPNGKTPPNWNTKGNIVCANYLTIIANNIVGTADYNKSIAIASNASQVRIRDSAYTTVNAFKTAMQGVYLYYELATPVETDISAYISDDNLIEVEAGGTLTMYSDANGDDDAYHIPVPSTVEYMIDLNVATGGTENEP